MDLTRRSCLRHTTGAFEGLVKKLEKRVCTCYNKCRIRHLSARSKPKKDSTMNNTHRFDGKSEIYAKARPKYAPELFMYLQNTLHIPAGSDFADIGSGTGIFTEQLLDCGYYVYAVEPGEDMRRKAEEKLSGNEHFTSIDGTASNTHLPDNSVDYITAAQAFHWFDAEAFREECRRILKPGGKVVIAYNSRVPTSPCTMALAEVHRTYNPEFHGFSNGMSHEKCTAFFAGGCDIFRADNTQTYDREGYINRVLSSSYSMKENDERYPKYLGILGALFDRFAKNGRLAVPMDTIAYSGEV